MSAKTVSGSWSGRRLTFKTDVVQPEDCAQFRVQMLAAVKATEATILLERK